MLRRNTRLRREYLYRKSLEGKEREYYEKKRKIRQALEEGKPIPTELRNEEATLRGEIDLEDEQTASQFSLFLINVNIFASTVYDLVW